MTRTTPRRRTTLHLSQILLTLGRTFMTDSSGWETLTEEDELSGRSRRGRECGSLVAIGDATPGRVVGGYLDGDAVAGQDLDVILPHPTADRGQHAQPVVSWTTPSNCSLSPFGSFGARGRFAPLPPMIHQACSPSRATVGHAEGPEIIGESFELSSTFIVLPRPLAPAGVHECGPCRGRSALRSFA
jgi:hypothetical protein